jgi:hypothetical protein
MAKTLKDFLNEKQLGPMVVKNPDEQKFIDKHVIAKTADRNGNDDELFKGSKVKMADRKKDRKGYNPGEDEDVYEELKGNQHKIDANKNGKVDAHDFHLLRKKKKVAEEAEELEDLSTDTLRNYRAKAKDDAYDAADVDDDRRLRKRSMGSWDAGKKILKRGDALRKEEAEQVNEKDAPHVKDYGPYGDRASSAKEKMIANFNKPKNKNEKPNRYTKEEVVDEKLDMKKASMGTVIKDFQKSDAPQFIGKSQKKRQVMAIAAKLSAERGGKPLNKEERLLTKLADLSETHQRTMVSVFEKLNEDNQYAFMQACDTADGIEQMLDFSISYRGE